MQTIPLTLAEEGMVLARDVARPENPSGPPICGRGMVLTSSLIERLQAIGIKTVVVEGHPLAMEGEPSLDDLLQAIDRRFRKVEKTPLMMELKEIYRALTIKSHGENGIDGQAD